MDDIDKSEAIEEWLTLDGTVSDENAEKIALAMCVCEGFAPHCAQDEHCKRGGKCFWGPSDKEKLLLDRIHDLEERLRTIEGAVDDV
ncbi:MAG: hypothetical protein ABEN55_00050 [Bradymonadaceae bacterium]